MIIDAASEQRNATASATSSGRTWRPAGTFVSPAFNLSLRLENPGQPGTTATVSVAGVRIDEWAYSLPEDDFVMEKVSFRALWVKVEDTTA